MTTRLNRMVSFGAAAAFVAVVGFSAGARAETTIPASGQSAAVAIDDLGPLCGHHYEVADMDPLCGHHYLGSAA